MDNEMDNRIVLVDENGKEEEFEVIATFDVEGKEYTVLLPIYDGEDNDEVIILRIDYDNEENPMLVSIEDEEEYENVVAVYEAISDEIH